MRFITITLIVYAPDPLTGEQKSTQERFGARPGRRCYRLRRKPV